MLTSQSRKGRKLAGHQNPVFDQDVVKLLKTQDAGYIITMLQKTKRAQAKLEQEFVLNDGQGAECLGALSSQEKGAHKVFVDSREEQKQYQPEDRGAFQPHLTRKPRKFPMNEEEDGSDGEPFVCLPMEPPKSRRAAERQELASKYDLLLRKLRRKEQNAQKLKLAALNAREKSLVEAKKKLDLQRAKMSNSVGGTTKTGAKWKVRERKK